MLLRPAPQTYNNQYPIITLFGWTPGAALVPGTMTVVEQIPGLVVWGDATQELERGYFPSYNVPYFPVIYNMSGYTQVVAKHGRLGDVAGIDYQMAPRAQIFRRDQGNVVDIDSFKAILRYNEYKTDPIAKGALPVGGSPAMHAVCGVAVRVSGMLSRARATCGGGCTRHAHLMLRRLTLECHLLAGRPVVITVARRLLRHQGIFCAAVCAAAGAHHQRAHHQRWHVAAIRLVAVSIATACWFAAGV